MYGPYRLYRKRTHFWVRAHFYSKSARCTFRYYAINIRGIVNPIVKMESRHLKPYPKPHIYTLWALYKKDAFLGGSKGERRTFGYHAANIGDMVNPITEMESRDLKVYPRPHVFSP